MNRVSSKFRPDKFPAIFLVAGIFACGLVFFSFPANASDITPQKVIELANSDREKGGLGILEENEKLNKSAMDKAEDMAQNNYFAHTSPSGLTPWHWIEKEKYEYMYAGENLAMDFISADKMNQAWLESPTHRANILNEKYKDIGVAVKEGVINGHSTTIVVQQFGSGDKNEIDAEDKISSGQPAKEKTSFPVLPPETQNSEKNKIFSFSPIITSPKEGDSIAGEIVEIVGRSTPGAKIVIWDGENEIAQAVSDEKGWFRNKVAMLSEGTHKMRVESEIFSGSLKKTTVSLNSVSFSVDRSQPVAGYRIYARIGAQGNREYFIRVTSSEPDCIFKVGGQMRNITNSRSAYFSVSENKLSSVIRIEDRAGNQSTKHIVLANYYQGSEQDNVINRAAQIFTNDNIFASESGRKTIIKNLGLAMANNN